MAEVVVHIDIDYFFAQVEEIRDPSLAGRPLGVQQNHEVAAVNYVARGFGLFNRISVAEALRLCPELVLVRGDNGVDGMQRYRAASQSVLFHIMSQLDELEARSGVTRPLSWVGRRVENPSFDDFYVAFDCSLAEAFQGRSATEADVFACASDFAAVCRGRIFRHTNLRCSAGIARSKLLSVCATKKSKPNGQHCVLPGQEQELFAAARLSSLKGAGLKGLPPSLRGKLALTLGEDAVVRQAREDFAGLETALSQEELRVLRCVLDSGDDGSVVAAFSLPSCVSMELNVRPVDHHPCTELVQVEAGYVTLAARLIERALSDVAIYGERRVAAIVAKWKLFPGARTVRQKQCQWPRGLVLSVAQQDVARLAVSMFRAANATSSFAISRLVLGLTYESHSSMTQGSATKRVSVADAGITAAFDRQRSIRARAAPGASRPAPGASASECVLVTSDFEAAARDATLDVAESTRVGKPLRGLTEAPSDSRLCSSSLRGSVLDLLQRPRPTQHQPVVDLT